MGCDFNIFRFIWIGNILFIMNCVAQYRDNFNIRLK